MTEFSVHPAFRGWGRVCGAWDVSEVSVVALNTGEQAARYCQAGRIRQLLSKHTLISDLQRTVSCSELVACLGSRPEAVSRLF